MPGPAALPDWRLIDKDIRIGKLHETLVKLAADYGGACTKKFAQEVEATEKGMGKFYRTREDPYGKWNGVCKALVSYWIAYHARDLDFWDWLMKEGTVSVGAAGVICATQSSYRRAIMTAESVDGVDVAWSNKLLGSYGIIPMKSITGGGALGASGMLTAPGTSPYRVGAMLTAAIAPARLYAGRYNMIRVAQASGGSHVMCGWVAQDVCFFDPNAGEFWFQTRAGFQMWFPQFWNLTYGKAGYDGRWEVRSYGRKLPS